MGRRKKHRNKRKNNLDIVKYLFIIAVFLWFTYPRIVALTFIILGMLIWAITTINEGRKFHSIRVAGIDRMSGEEFEDYVAKLLRFQGYKVEQIGGFNDMGIDLIASRQGTKHAVQIKRWKKEVGLSAVRAAVAGRAHFDCDKAVVITNNYFTERAKELAKSNRCKLIGREELALQIKSMQAGKSK